LPACRVSRTEAIAQTSGKAEEKLSAAIQRFEQRLESVALQTQENAAERMRVETLAKVMPELEGCRAQIIDQTQNHVKQTLEAALSEFGQRLQTSAAQAQESVSERLKAETLSKLLPEMVARQVETIDQARERVKQTVELSLNDFQQKLQATASQTEDWAAERLRVETLAKLGPELEARQAEAINQAQNQVKQALEAALGEFEQRLRGTAAQAQQSASEQLRTETLAKLGPELEARQAEAINEAQNQVKQTLEAALGEFEQRLKTTATQAQESISERLSDQVLGRLTPQIEARHAEAIQQTNDRIGQNISSGLKSFQEELRTASAEVRQAAIERLSTEMLAGLAPQLETRQWEAVEQTQKRIADKLEASFREFEQRLQTASAQSEKVTIEKLGAKFLSTLAPELHSCQTGILEQTRGQTQQLLESALGEFRQQLRLAASQTQEATTEQLSAGILTRIVPQLEARQAETLDETRKQAQQTRDNSLSEFNALLQTVVAQARQTALEGLTAQLLGQLQPELESRQNAAVDQTQVRVQEALQAGLGDFDRSLKAAAGQAQQVALEKMISEAPVKLKPVFEDQQAGILGKIRGQMAVEIQEGVRSLREHVANQITECQKSADSLLQKPSELIQRYAEDTMAMLREEMIEQRNSAIESAKLEVRAMMRSTLNSLNEEASAFTGEFRDQIKSAWEGMKSRGLEELETLHKEAAEQHRESVLEHLQKDAEDLTHVAVGQFRAQSEEAIHEANNAINKQVGAAAFLLKDWMDQATTRLERCLDKVETRAETAFEAAQVRSLKLQMEMMERVHHESEEIALELHDRFQQAASALRGGLSRIPDEAPHAAGHDREEPKIPQASSRLER